MSELAKLLETWEPVIGLEVHVQLATKSKAFSPSAIEFGARPSSLTDPLQTSVIGGAAMSELAKLLETWEPVIGLEVHVQLATKSKAFSPSAVEFDARPSSLTDPLQTSVIGVRP